MVCRIYEPDKTPIVNDLFLFVPRKHNRILDERFKLNHKAWAFYKTTYQLNNYDMGFMVPGNFDSNSHKDFNPYYFIAGRDEAKTMHNSKLFELDETGKEPLETCDHPFDEFDQPFLQDPTHYYLMKHKGFYG